MCGRELAVFNFVTTGLEQMPKKSYPNPVWVKNVKVNIIQMLLGYFDIADLLVFSPGSHPKL